MENASEGSRARKKAMSGSRRLESSPEEKSSPKKEGYFVFKSDRSIGSSFAKKISRVRLLFPRLVWHTFGQNKCRLKEDLKVALNEESADRTRKLVEGIRILPNCISYEGIRILPSKI